MNEALSAVARSAKVALPAYLPGMGFSLDPPPPPWHNSQYACERPTPLKSAYNQGIVDALATLMLQRELTGDARGSLSYAKALSVIKSYPGDLVAHPEQAKQLKGVGQKISRQVQQYASTGRIPEVELILLDPTFTTLKTFNEVYRIGPSRARDLWAQGFRTIDDLVRSGVWSPVGEGKNAISVEEALAILPDLRICLTREETEHITSKICALMEEVIPGTESMVTGGYRRGKPTSSDIDLLFTSPPGAQGDEQLQWTHVEQLLAKMKQAGCLTHYISASGRPNDPFLEQASIVEVVVKIPPLPGQKELHRRVDLMFCRRDAWGAMAVGWTGSKMFERDLRRRAKELDLKFHSDALVDRFTNQFYPTPHEEDVFRILRLPYMLPEWRNCDP